MVVIDWNRAPNKGSERVALLVKGVRIRSSAIVGAPASSLGLPGPGQGPAIKAYCVAPRTRSVFSRSAQEKLSSHTMKFFIVLFAVVAAASAGLIGGYGGGGYGAIAQPWAAPVVHASPVVHAAPVVHAPLPWVAPAPVYAKVAAPVAYAKKTYHVANIPQQPAIPPPHPQPLSIHGNDHVTRLHYSGPHVGHPHLVGVEHYVQAPEPAISVVKAGHGGWD